MSGPFRVACVQTNSVRDVAPNLAAITALVDAAAAAGAQFVLLPENVAMLEPEPQRQWEKASPEAGHPAVETCSRLAARHGLWLLAGSVSIRLGGGKLANRSVLFDASGAIVARYDKIHLFDVDLGNGERYRESATIVPGARSVLASLPWGRLGMSICYDVRFPQLYRHLAKAGAHFLAVPAAFTRVTGMAHWHTLLRARAIETGCFVFAPAQTGEHANGRQTYGHSLIVNPWGEILADGGEDVGIITADVDPAEVAAARRRIPALSHDRPFA